MAETVGQHSVAAFTSPVNGTSPIDANTVKGNDNTIRSAYVDHDADPGIHVQSSTLASRPVANSAGRKWMTQDSGVIRLFYDDGTNWYEVDYLRTTGGTISGNLSITGTLAVTGVATFTAQPILSSLTASRAVFTDGSKGLVSNAITGTGDVVMSASPTLTGTITAASATLSGTLGVSGLLTFASLKGTGATTVTNILDEDNMASDSATALATQQSIKAYVDAQVGASDALSEVLAIGNTTGANDIIVSAGQKIRTPAVAAQDGSSAITIANTTGALTLATALADSNLATISTAGKVSNSATTATSANTASAIVARDASGNFTAGTITAALTGNASTATTLQTARNINGVSFNGSADITVTAAAGTLTGTTLASNVTASSLTSVGTLANLTVTNPITGSVTGSSGSTTGNAATATALQTARNINGVSFNGTADITVTAAAGTLTGTTLASGVTASSLTSVGTLTSLTVSGAITGATSTNTINGLVINSGGLGGATGIKFGIGAAFSSGQAEAYTTSTTPMGIGTVGAQPLRFYTNSALVAAFDSSGNLAVDTNTLYVDATNNRVGVGTASPATLLHVASSGYGEVARFYDFSGNGFSFTADGNTGYNQLTSTGAQPLLISVNGSERARIDASGRLGIGTTSPSSTLHVSTAGTALAQFTGGEYSQIRHSDGTRTLLTQVYNNLGVIGTESNTPLAFNTNNTERMRLDASGRLGIGKTPAYPLNVEGSVVVDGDNNERMIGFDFYSNLQYNLYVNGAVDAAKMTVRRGTTDVAAFDASGRLGIGTTGPGVALDVVNSTLGIVRVRGGGGTNEGGAFFISNSAGSSTLAAFGDYARIGGGATDASVSIYTNASIPLRFDVGGTEKMRLDASGNLGIGTSSPAGRIDATDSQNGLSYYSFRNTSTGGSAVTRFRVGNSGSENAFTTDVYGGSHSTKPNIVEIFNQFNAALVLGTNGTERARITSGGYFKASDDGTYINASGTYHEIRSTTNNGVLYVQNTNASFTDAVLVTRTTKAAGTDFNFIVSQANFVNQFAVRGDGNVTNTNGSYGTISDERLKQDIVDASSQWDDIKAVRFRKYRMKTDVEANPDAPFMLGVVAQELELVSPGLVDEHPNEDGTTTKTVKSSILLMKAAVALQEAMARIESLEARLAALES